MNELIKVLKEINNNFYKGHHTLGERYDLVKDINKLLKDKKFI